MKLGFSSWPQAASPPFARALLLGSLLGPSACSDEPSTKVGTNASDGDASASTAEPDGGVSEAGALPAECAPVASVDADCAAKVPSKPSAVACQGAPIEMVTKLKCKYLRATVGTGNLYCCPGR